MELYIDSSIREAALVELRHEGQIVDRVSITGDRGHAQHLLSEIDKLVSKHGDLAMIDCITVHPGPGSFTGVRVGVSIANTLALALGVTVNGHTPPILPVYDAPPPGQS